MQHPGFLLAKGWQLAWNIVSDHYQDIDLTPQQIALLHCLGCAGEISQRDLAEAMVIDAATMTGLVTRLEKMALICRTRDAADRRLVKLTLTGSGEELLQIFQERGPLVEARFQERLGDTGVAELCRLLREFLGWTLAEDEPSPRMTLPDTIRPPAAETASPAGEVVPSTIVTGGRKG
ncbi:MAG: hypothetical protein GEEBNDBF_02174 [bacterium]|nr:hypothetical protein [bacterium]